MSVLVLEGVYYNTHIDTTILPLSSTKLLYLKERISHAQMKKKFGPHGYTVFIGVSYRDFVHMDAPVNNMASMAIAMNLLQISEESLVIEEKQERLGNILESHGFAVHRIPFPFARDFSGSLHCATCPLDRRTYSEC